MVVFVFAAGVNDAVTFVVVRFVVIDDVLVVRSVVDVGGMAGGNILFGSLFVFTFDLVIN